jgi:hypothetical protein
MKPRSPPHGGRRLKQTEIEENQTMRENIESLPELNVGSGESNKKSALDFATAQANTGNVSGGRKFGRRSFCHRAGSEQLI